MLPRRDLDHFGDINEMILDLVSAVGAGCLGLFNNAFEIQTSGSGRKIRWHCFVNGTSPGAQAARLLLVARMATSGA
jgi:hypothetical protein